MAEHLVQLLHRYGQPLAVGRVHDQNYVLKNVNMKLLLGLSLTTILIRTHISHLQIGISNAYLCVRVVGVPGGPERVLTAEVPHDEVDVLPHDLLDVGPDRRGRVHNLQ